MNARGSFRRHADGHDNSEGWHDDPLKTYTVTVEGEVGRVDASLAPAVQGA